MTLRIEHFNRVLNTPGLLLAVRGWYELLCANLIDPGAPAVGWDHRAIVAFDGDMPVGVLTWFDQEWTGTVQVALAYVMPEHRRRGVHTALWEALKDKAVELKRAAISSSTHMRNTASRASMSKQGRVEDGVYLRYEVKS